MIQWVEKKESDSRNILFFFFFLHECYSHEEGIDCDLGCSQEVKRKVLLFKARYAKGKE